MNRKYRRQEVKNLPKHKLQPEPQVRRVFQKIGRNDLCPCGSGVKYKKCSCYGKDEEHYETKN